MDLLKNQYDYVQDGDVLIRRTAGISNASNQTPCKCVM